MISKPLSQWRIRPFNLNKRKGKTWVLEKWCKTYLKSRDNPRKNKITVKKKTLELVSKSKSVFMERWSTLMATRLFLDGMRKQSVTSRYWCVTFQDAIRNSQKHAMQRIISLLTSPQRSLSVSTVERNSLKRVTEIDTRRIVLAKAPRLKS